MFDDIESDDELEEFVQHYKPSRLSKKELNNAKARIRGAINRESKASKKRQDEMASYILNYAAQRSHANTSAANLRKRKEHGVMVGVSRLSSSVLSTLDVRVPIHVEGTRHVPIASAQTDFKSINIYVNLDNYNAEDRHGLASLIHMTKGLVYHEGGHVKWTTPFNKLVELSGRTDLKGGDKYRLIRAWNVLEDQRMETAMCSVSPIMGKYFTSIVLNVVINLQDIGANWPWIAGRTYLPTDIRQMIRDAAEERDINGIIDAMTNCVMGYRKSKCPKEMMRYVIQFSGYLKLWGADPKSPDTHNWDNWGYGEDYSDAPTPDSIPDVQDQPLEKPSSGITRPVKEDPKPDEKPEHDKEPDKVVKSDKDETQNGGSGAPSSGVKEIPTVDNQRIAEELAQRISEEIEDNVQSVKDHELDDFISTVNEHSSKPVLTDPTISLMNNKEIESTVEVTNSMVSVLERLVVQVDPAWRGYQEEGVLDPTLFRLREPGDTNFWSGLDGEGNNGHDIALSVLIDSSGSMGGKMDKVSVSAMGIRKACEQLGIPCTITTFNDDVYMVADANENVDYIRVSSTGGTSVINAMMALEDQRCGKTYHLVIILTDGEWSDVSDTRLWSHPSRSITIVGFGYGMDGYISNKGADHWLVIEDLMELPNIVTDSLVRHFV